jgi:hypothetical protein
LAPLGAILGAIEQAKSIERERQMSTRTNPDLAVSALAVMGVSFLAALGGCSGDGGRTSGSITGSGDASISGSGTADGSATGSDGGASGIPIVAGGSPDVPYQFGPNAYGITGAAFFAKSNNGATTVLLDKTQVGKVCLTGTVDIVPTPADGGHPPYSDYWGIDVGFNLNQDAEGGPTGKTPWSVPPNVIGFWFTVEGAAIPDIRFKTTPTGKDPAQEQDSCALVTPTSGVPNPVLFTDMYVQCWDGPQGTAPTDITVGLLDVGLQVAADTSAAHALDFCWTGFGVITK